MSEVIEERSQSTTRKVRDQIVASDPINIKPASKSNRVYAPNLSSSDFKKIITDLFNVDANETAAKQPGSLSSQFSTFTFPVGDDEVSIVLAKGIVRGAEGESTEISGLQKQIDDVNEDGEGITVRVAGEDYHNITGVEKVAGNKKADFQLVNKDGTPVIFIQHKSPKHQQISGISKFDKSTYNEVATFVDDVRNAVASEGRLTKPFIRPIQNADLKQLAVYGTLDGTFASSAIQVYCVGTISLVKTGTAYTIKGSKETYEYPNPLPDTEQPILVATYRSDRRQEGIPDVRFGVYSKSYRP